MRLSFCVSSLITYPALTHFLVLFPDVPSLMSVGSWASAWSPGFSGSVTSGSVQLSRPDKDVGLLFFLPDVCFSNCARLCYLDAYSYNR